MPARASDPAQSVSENRGVTQAPTRVNLGPFNISGQIVLLLDDAPSPAGPLGPIVVPGTPAAAPGGARIDEFLQRLASPDFREREAAQAELTRLARRVPGVEQAIDQAIDGISDPEARARVQRILQDLSGDEAEQYAEQARILFGNLLAIGQRFPGGSDLENGAQADLKEAMEDFKAARQDLRRSGVDARRRRAMERGKRLDERRRRLNPLGDFFGPG